MTHTIPTLETERLILRGWQMADLEALVTLYGRDDDNAIVHVGGPMPRDSVWRVMCLRAGHWNLRGHGQFALEEKSTRAFVGWCGSLHHDEDLEPELHYGVAKGMRGKGYATEAVVAAVEHALHAWRFPRLVAWIRPENTASQRIVTKAGAAFLESTERYGKPAQVWQFLHREART